MLNDILLTACVNFTKFRTWVQLGTEMKVKGQGDSETTDGRVSTSGGIAGMHRLQLILTQLITFTHYHVHMTVVTFSSF